MGHKVNLFIIGAMKSGTTSLHVHLASHPSIFMSPVKEPDHFAFRSESYLRRRRYSKLFRNACEEEYFGESSTSYSKLPLVQGVAQRIRKYNPAAKFIYLLRDPFERVVSHYKHMVRGHMVSKSLGRWISDNPNPLLFSDYAFQLQPYIEHFGLSAVYLGTFESLADSPGAFYEGLFSWLGIDTTFVPPDMDRRLHPSPPGVRVVKDDHTYGKILRKIRRLKPVRKLLPVFPPSWLANSLPGEYLDFQSKEFLEEVQTVRDVTGDLLGYWITNLEEITGRSFDGWSSRTEGPDLGSVSLFKDTVDELKRRFGGKT